MSDVDRFTTAARLRDPVTGEERDVRIVVDRDCGVSFELSEVGPPFASTCADITRWAPDMRDSLVAILGPKEEGTAAEAFEECERIAASWGERGVPIAAAIRSRGNR